MQESSRVENKPTIRFGLELGLGFGLELGLGLELGFGLGCLTYKRSICEHVGLGSRLGVGRPFL